MPPARLRATAAMIVAPHVVATLIIAITALGEGLAEAGLSAAAAVNDPECSSFPDE